MHPKFSLSLVRRKAESKGDYVFGKSDGEPCKTAGQRVRNAIARAKLKNFRLHDLQHDHATKLIRSNSNKVSLYEVSKVLGHSRVEVTQRYADLCNQSIATKTAKVLDDKDQEG